MHAIPAKAFVTGFAGLLLLGVSCVATWTSQDWRYGQQLESKDRLHAETLAEQALALVALQRTEQSKRLKLERELKQRTDTHYREFIVARTAQNRLRDRLATADLRLSVLLNTNNPDLDSMPASTIAGGVVHAASRAHLDPAHAQRIIGITDDGDRGMIALAACQAYALAVSNSR